MLRSGVLPRWLGWVMVALAIIGATPIGFAAAIGTALLVLVLSIMLAVRARSAASPTQGRLADTKHEAPLPGVPNTPPWCRLTADRGR